MEQKIEFEAYNVFLKFLKTDKSVRVEMDTSKDQYDEIKEIPNLPNGTYKVTIEPLIIEQ